jgi:shikimate 5-dehydrogenase
MARREESAAELLHGTPDRGGPPPRTTTFEALRDEAAAADVIVNGTTVGLHGQEAAFPGLVFRPGQLAVDFVYG